jgi:hypothetical protein
MVRRFPAPLQWIIGRCLEKEPGGRYESTRDLYADLKPLRDHLSQSRRPRPPRRLYATAMALSAVMASPRLIAQSLKSSPPGVADVSATSTLAKGRIPPLWRPPLQSSLRARPPLRPCTP